MQKKIFAFICAVLLISSLVFSYINLPDMFICYEGRNMKINTIGDVTVPFDAIEASKGEIIPKKTGSYEASLSIFGIPYKEVTVRVLEDDEVIVGGVPVGIRLYADSLIVVAVGRVNENEASPAESAGIKIGDEIISINGEKAGNPDEFTEKIENSTGEIELTVKTGDETRNVKLKPSVSKIDNVKRIGLWVRDSTAGVGTLTYIDPESMTYGALGHGVSDLDTGVKFSVKEGSIERCAVSDISRGEKGTPGELKGSFYSNGKTIGNIIKNEKEGIFGKVTVSGFEGERVKLGHKNEIKKGEAYIRASLGEDICEDYKIEIVKVAKNSKNPAKGLVIKVVDERLIEKTGGIVQGMSGSPILQEGKLIGAVTHVLVNDPTKGYGIFIENMMEAAG